MCTGTRELNVSNMSLTSQNIKNHFIENPEWERVFLKHHPDWTPENYIEKAKALFEANGYKFVENRKFKSDKFKHILDLDLHGPPSKDNEDGFVFGMQGHEDFVYSQVIISAICEYEVDISKFN